MQNKSCSNSFYIIIFTALYTASGTETDQFTLCKVQSWQLLNRRHHSEVLEWEVSESAMKGQQFNLFFKSGIIQQSLIPISFIFDFGIDYGIELLSDGTNSHFSDDMNFDHLLMGFPLLKGWGFGSRNYPLQQRLLFNL